MTLPEVLLAFRRSALLMILLFVVALGGSVAYLAVQTPKYEATSSVFVATGAGDNAADLTFAQQIVGSYAELATKTYVLDPVVQALNLNGTGEDLAEDVVATAETDKLLIAITATSPSPQQAADIANQVASQLTKAVRAINPTTKAADFPVTLTTVQQASVPTVQSTPSVFATLIAGAILGLVLGIAVALVRARTDTRVRSTKDLEKAFHHPVLGVLPAAPSAPSSVTSLDHPSSASAEAYRALRTNLQFLNADEPVDAIVVTSAMPGEGKSTCVTNLAVVTASAERRVLIVDADLRKPRIAAYTGLDDSIGLTDVLVGRATFEDAVQTWGPKGLFVLPAGTSAPNPSELLQSRAMAALVEKVRADYDLVIFDSPPLTAVADASIVARLTSGALIACAMDKTRGPQTEVAVDALTKVQANVLGFVATFSHAKARSTSQYGDTAPAKTRKPKPKPRGAGGSAVTDQ